MKTQIASDLICGRRGDEASRPALPTSCPTAFTVIELLVVIATLAILAAMLLPALAGTQSQSKVTACTARFRQWAVSHNLYANDNRGWLPSLVPQGGGALAWDVGLNLCNTLYPYGMDVPDWFCPMRPNQWDAANAWGRTILGHPIQNGNDLTKYFSHNYPQECVINDNYWVPRASSPAGIGIFPIDYSGRPQTIWPVWLKQGMPTSAIYGWAQRLHDIAASQVPFVSDSAGSGNSGGLLSTYPASPSVTNISPNTAHFVNGTLIGVNLAFADGHVASHSPSQMRTVYYNGASYWFY
ncbi:MAG TPA: hypothetical protein VKU37_11880 [Verrucomicrobiae bacterium]|nr:hypothetical protein [Verrucomicrobiae bacterium]